MLVFFNYNIANPKRMTFAPNLIKEMDESMDFIITNLKHQYIIPNHAYGWSKDEHHNIEGIVSKFKCTIELKNVNNEDDEEDPTQQDVGNALADMAEIIVMDFIDMDCSHKGGYDTETNTRLPPIRFFKMDYTRTITKQVEINEETFEVTLTYERTYA